MDNKEKEPKVIHYNVDGEPQESLSDKLTIAQILKAAGKDPESHYLILLEGNKQTSYEQYSQDTQIHLKNGMRFIAPSRKPTPVS
jgi:hypothetical protein